MSCCIWSIVEKCGRLTNRSFYDKTGNRENAELDEITRAVLITAELREEVEEKIDQGILPDKGLLEVMAGLGAVLSPYALRRSSGRFFREASAMGRRSKSDDSSGYGRRNLQYL